MEKKWSITNQLTFEADLLNAYLPTSPWVGHRYFAYDLVMFMEPERIVELGTHYGCSFFAFTQAVKNKELSTELVAVDTWEGDIQAGFYDEHVYNTVIETINEYFNKLDIKLKRMLFSEALNQIDNESIDILHIDGLHTYEAVSEDYHTWLPKLKSNGIILFHDIAKYTNYGSSVFWEEIKRQHNYFEFEHSWGLGILFPKGNELYLKLLKENFFDKIYIYTYKAKYDYSKHEVSDLTKMSNERFEAIQSMERLIIERDRRTEQDSKLLNERYVALEEMEKLIIERDERIKHDSELLKERLNTIESMEEMIQERDKRIDGDSCLLQERYEVIQKMEQMILERDSLINTQKENIEGMKKHELILNESLITKENQIEMMSNELNSRLALLKRLLIRKGD